MAYGDEKEEGGVRYRGMKVGGVHRWSYPDGKWTERKVSPQRWDVAFTSRKVRRNKAPDDSGAEVGSGYHWFIVAHQWAGKMDANTYATHLEGTKHLLSFRKPGWQGWTTQQRGHTSARLRSIMVLEEILAELREMRDEDFEDPQDGEALLGLLSGEGAEPSMAAPSAILLPPKARARRRVTSRPARVRRQARRGRPAGRAATAAPARRRR